MIDGCNVKLRPCLNQLFDVIVATLQVNKLMLRVTATIYDLSFFQIALKTCRRQQIALETDRFTTPPCDGN